MNEYLQSYIEPELEARICALVLGEASAFEAGELERLMSERPELKRYQIGLEKTHELLGEAHEVQDNLEWKLSDECRGKILVKINEKNREEMVEKRRKRISIIAQRRLIYTLAACLFLTLVIVVLNQPRSLESERSSIVAESQPGLEEENLGIGLASQSPISPASVVLEGSPRNRLSMQRDMIEEPAKLKKSNSSLTGEMFGPENGDATGEGLPSEKLSYVQKQETGLEATRSSNENKKIELGARAKARSVRTRDNDEASAGSENSEVEAELALQEMKVQAPPVEKQSESSEPEKKPRKKGALEGWGNRILLPTIILLSLFLAWRWAKRIL
tara:strand:+ start:24122 stop:25114 length:993 start_codon:yes stop_codon:yes gene_type:complete